MSATDRTSYGRAVELIRPTGDPLELVAARYMEAWEVLRNGAALVQAATVAEGANSGLKLAVNESITFDAMPGARSSANVAIHAIHGGAGTKQLRYFEVL